MKNKAFNPKYNAAFTESGAIQTKKMEEQLNCELIEPFYID